MAVNCIFTLLSVFMILFGPFLIIGYCKKFFNCYIRFFDVICGIVCIFLSKYVIYNLILNLIYRINHIQTVLSSENGVLIVSMLSMTLILTITFLLMNKLYYQNKIEIGGALGIALGATITEVLANIAGFVLSNVIYLFQISNGTFINNLMQASLTMQQARYVVDLYASFPQGYYLYFGIVTIAFMCSYLLTGILISKKDMFKKNCFLILLLSFVGIFTIIYRITNPITFKYADLIICIFVLLQVMVLLNMDRLFMVKKV